MEVLPYFSDIWLELRTLYTLPLVEILSNLYKNIQIYSQIFLNFFMKPTQHFKKIRYLATFTLNLIVFL